MSRDHSPEIGKLEKVNQFKGARVDHYHRTAMAVRDMTTHRSAQVVFCKGRPSLLLTAVLLLTVGASPGRTLLAQTAPVPLSITLAHDDQPERQTRDQLLRLAAAYPLSSWIFTREITVTSDRQVVPHSHPVLTLSTRHLRDDELLLSTFVHEQLHWYLVGKPSETSQAVQALRELLPSPPVGAREGGETAEDVYRHLLVCRLEYSALKQLLGELRAREVVQFWAGDHYPWAYGQALARDQDLGAVLQRAHLLPVARNEAK